MGRMLLLHTLCEKKLLLALLSRHVFQLVFLLSWCRVISLTRHFLSRELQRVKSLKRGWLFLLCDDLAATTNLLLLLKHERLEVDIWAASTFTGFHSQHHGLLLRREHRGALMSIASSSKPILSLRETVLVLYMHRLSHHCISLLHATGLEYGSFFIKPLDFVLRVRPQTFLGGGPWAQLSATTLTPSIVLFKLSRCHWIYNCLHVCRELASFSVCDRWDFWASRGLLGRLCSCATITVRLFLNLCSWWACFNKLVIFYLAEL